MIDFDMLDEEYDNLPTHERIPRGERMKGSLTDNLRIAEPNRNGAHKRARSLAREMKYHTNED